jgi:hypothetical protein
MIKREKEIINVFPFSLFPFYFFLFTFSFSASPHSFGYFSTTCFIGGNVLKNA